MEKRKQQRLGLVLAMALGGGTTFQVIPGCAQLFGNAGAAAVDFCFLLDCQNGFFGGLAQPCDPQGGFSLFIDCPTLTPPFGTGLGVAPNNQGNNAGGAAGAGAGQNAGGGAAGGGGRGGFGPAVTPPANQNQGNQLGVAT